MSELRPPSEVAGVIWPAVPPRRFQPLLALMAQLERSQWWPTERLLDAQLAQAKSLIRHAQGTSPGWAERLAGVEPDGIDADSWGSLPILERADLQADADGWHARTLPAGHGAATTSTTSGSTGAPVTVRRTGWDATLWQAFTVRDTLWHRRDPGRSIAVVRHGTSGDPERPGSGWAPWAALFGPPGPLWAMEITRPLEEQLDWLLRVDPAYLLTFPTHLGHLVELSEARGARPRSLRAVAVLSEPVGPELRARLRAAWDVPLQDLYSSQESGYLALQCPDHEHLHVMSEGVLLEVLDNDGRPCAPGEVGRVVVTSLHGFGTPLVRYALGDYAEVGPPCPCGRGLPVLTRVLGRARNSLVDADGGRRWPFLGVGALVAQIPSVRRLQLVQERPGEVEARVVFGTPPDGPTLDAVRAHLEAHLPGFRARAVSVDDLPRSPSGKFEDVISRIAP